MEVGRKTKSRIPVRGLHDYTCATGKRYLLSWIRALIAMPCALRVIAEVKCGVPAALMIDVRLFIETIEMLRIRL